MPMVLYFKYHQVCECDVRKLFTPTRQMFLFLSQAILIVVYIKTKLIKAYNTVNGHTPSDIANSLGNFPHFSRRFFLNIHLPFAWQTLMKGTN